MAAVILLPPREPDAIARTPLNIRRADAWRARNRRQHSLSGASMGNVRPVDTTTQLRVLADFFTLGHVANVPSVEADNLRQAVADLTPDIQTRSGEER